MTKLLAFLTAMLLFITPVLAEGIDLDSLTLDELVELRSLINDEINTRLAETSSVFYPFDYIVGTDIPAGRYIITVSTVESIWGYLRICAAGTTDFKFVDYLELEKEYTVTLQEGDIIRIEDCTVFIRPYIVPTI